MSDNTRTTLRSIVPILCIVDGATIAADERATQLCQAFNTYLRDQEAAGQPRTKFYLCEASPTTALLIDEAEGGDPRTLSGLTIDALLVADLLAAVDAHFAAPTGSGAKALTAQAAAGKRLQAAREAFRINLAPVQR